jgi:tRNA-specific 2-thiouridylase
MPGPILDTSGAVVGEHKGIAFYTIGQRRRLGIAAREPRYVVEIDPGRNAIIVGRDSDLYASELIATDLNFVPFEKPAGAIAVTAKIRYNMNDSQALLSPQGEDQALVRFDSPQRAITPGQAVVCYDGEDVVGGGTIDAVRR